MIKRPYFVRLMMYCTCISLVPTLVLGFVLSQRASESIQDKVDEANASILYQNKQRVEQVLDNADRLVAQLMTSTLAYDLLARKLEPIDFRDLEDLKQALANVQSLEPVIRDIYFVNLDYLWSVSNRGWQTYERKEQMEPLLRYADPARAGAWVVPSEQDGEFGRRVVLGVKNLPANALKPQGLLIMVLSADSLEKLVAVPGSQSATMIMDAQGRSFAGDTRYEPNVRALASWEKEPAADLTQRSAFSDGGSKVVVQRQISARNGWQYVMGTSIREVTRDAREMIWFTVMLVAILLGVVLLLAFYGSRRMYRPIQQIMKLFRSQGRSFAFGRSADEVTYIYDRIQVQSRQLSEFFMTKLCQDLVPRHQIRQRFGEHGYQPDAWRSLRTGVIQLDSLNGTRFGEKDQDLLLFAVNNIVNDIVPGQDRLDPVVVGGAQVTVFADAQQDEAAFRERTDRYMRDVQKTVLDILGISVSIGVSRIFAEPEDIPIAYQEGLEALKYRLSLGDHTLIYIQDVEATDERHHRYPVKAAEMLFQAVQALEPAAQIEARLDEVLCGIFHERNSARKQSVYLGQLVFEFIGFMQKTDDRLAWGPEGQDGLSGPNGPDTFADTLLRMSNRDEIRRFLLARMIEPTVKALMDRRDRQYEAIADFITACVEKEYNRNLTLESCAERLNYHPDYVGRVFRRMRGIGFAEYLSAFRLNLAKRLLADTEMKITEISQHVGYANPQNFIRHFRKQEGMTPGAYREQSI